MQTSLGIAKWIHLVKLLELETVGEDCRLQIAPKLTAAHIYLYGFQTMSVRLAVQVMSHSVAAG